MFKKCISDISRYYTGKEEAIPRNERVRTSHGKKGQTFSFSCDRLFNLLDDLKAVQNPTTSGQYPVHLSYVMNALKWWRLAKAYHFVSNEQIQIPEGFFESSVWAKYEASSSFDTAPPLSSLCNPPTYGHPYAPYKATARQASFTYPNQTS